MDDRNSFDFFGQKSQIIDPFDGMPPTPRSHNLNLHNSHQNSNLDPENSHPNNLEDRALSQKPPKSKKLKKSKLKQEAMNSITGDTSLPNPFSSQTPTYKPNNSNHYNNLSHSRYETSSLFENKPDSRENS